MQPVLVKNAERMMTKAVPKPDGIEVTFADGGSGLVPYAAVPEVSEVQQLAAIDLPSAYELVLETAGGERVEIPWDFARHYCDDSYRPNVERIAADGRRALGSRIRQFRESAGLTQEALAAAAGLGRVTLVRVEKGEQSPRFETLSAVARALGRGVEELVVEVTVSEGLGGSR